ncbi:MAG: hypothetical protein PWR01_2142 [Clostridiales bacterium]|nr:hypothetical protein [Clostridiales bacterium]MDN5281069.1 hypothetical protein [Candidatus Ozemobacter sp.]
MILFKLAWRNIWRNVTRTMIQIMVIAGSLFFVIWMQNISCGSYEKMIADSVRSGSGHLAFQHSDYLSERRPELVIPADKALKLAQNHDEIKHILPRLQIPGLIRSSRENCSAMILGVDFNREKEVNVILADKRKVEGRLPTELETTKAYVGEKLALRLQVKLGQKIVFMFQNLEGVITSKLYRIAGIFRSGVGKIDSGMVFVDRRSLGKAFGDPDAVHEVALILKDRTTLESIKKTLEMESDKSMPESSKLLAWETTMKQLADAIKIDQANLQFMIFLLYVLVTIGTINLLLMSVLERTREFGLLRAIGFEKSRIRNLIGFEAILVGTIGSFFGLLVGTLASAYSWHYGLDFSAMFGAQEVAGMLFEPTIKSIWNWKWMFGLTTSMIFMVYLASIYPAGKAMRVNPSEAMRSYQ